MLNVENPNVEHDTLNIEHQTVKQLAGLGNGIDTCSNNCELAVQCTNTRSMQTNYLR